MVAQSRDDKELRQSMIDTVLRLQDGSTVPIRLSGTRCGWLQVVTINDAPPRICKRGHIIIGKRCIECKRRQNRLYKQAKKGK